MLRETHNSDSGMVKLSELVSETAQICDISVATCREVSRQLREAKLIQTGTGGRYGGANMSPEDAAALLTALMINSGSTIHLKNIADQTKYYLRGLKAHGGVDNAHFATWDKRLSVNQLCELDKGHSFGEAFTALIRSVSIGEFKLAVENWINQRRSRVRPSFSTIVEIRAKPYREAFIEFRAPEFRSISLLYIPKRDAKFVTPAGPRGWSSVSNDLDLRVSASIRETTLKAIGELLNNNEEGR